LLRTRVLQRSSVAVPSCLDAEFGLVNGQSLPPSQIRMTTVSSRRCGCVPRNRLPHSWNYLSSRWRPSSYPWDGSAA